MHEIGNAPQGYRVLDYGAGRGQAWREFLRARPDIELLAFEPDRRSQSELIENLASTSAKVLTELTLLGDLAVDCVVSFSVFEHVFDRRRYLATARAAMKDSGLFILNYDDGHFRPNLQLGDVQGWTRALHVLRETAGNLLWPALVKAGVIGPYQARVTRTEADALVQSAGLRIECERYENLVSLKELAKLVPAEEREAFHRRWAALEDGLNAEFSHVEGPRYGDRCALWQVMPTRTLRLRRLPDA
jgi:SAM-dependent methyltransferase